MSDDILNSGLPADDAEKIADAAAKPVDLANDVDWRLRVASLEDEVRELKAALFEHKDVLESHAVCIGDLLAPPDGATGEDDPEHPQKSRIEKIEDSLRSLLHPSKWAEAGLTP
jgi:hypothetical protein